MSCCWILILLLLCRNNCFTRGCCCNRNCKCDSDCECDCTCNNDPCTMIVGCSPSVNLTEETTDCDC